MWGRLIDCQRHVRFDILYSVYIQYINKKLRHVSRYLAWMHNSAYNCPHMRKCTELSDT
jgi:hypothetical protein